jgi:hypothetical protein
MPKEEVWLRLAGVPLAKIRAMLQQLDVEKEMEVVKAGLKLLEWYLKKRSEGYEILLVKGDRVYAVDLSDVID